MAKSPVSIPFSTDGLELAVKDGDTLVADSRGSVLVGADGSTAKFVNVDSSGRVLVVGAGVAGTPAGGVVSIQGVSGGQATPISASSLPLPTGAATEATLGGVLTTSAFQARINTLGQKTMANSTPVVLASDQSAVPVTGTVTASNPSVSATGSAVPASATMVGGSDGTNLQAPRVFDADTGGGTQYVLGAVLRKTASGGSVEAGTSSDPLRVDPTGTTTQPVSAASLPLPTGAATEVTLAGVLTTTAFQARINTLGQKTMANSTPVTLASDQSSVPVTAAQGTAAGLSGYWPVCITDGTNTMPTADTAARSSFHRVTDGTNTAAVKAASTAPVASDPALVVAISPNSSLTASNPSVGSNNAAIPTSSTQIGGSDGTNLQAARVFDADTGGGTQYVLGAILRKGASGGSVEAGTSSDPLRVDPTGTTTQPISAASLPLPTGAAADATLTGGTQKAIVRGGAKGSTTAADVTSTASGANHQPLDVAIYDASGNQITSFGGGTQYADGAARGSATGTLMLVDDGTNVQSASGDSSGRLNVKVQDASGNTMPTADTVARSSFHRITDGTNTAAVKAASTAPVAADPALVVAISPNSPVSTADGVASGNLTAATQNVATAATAGQGSAAIQITGTWAATLSFEGTVDGTNWAALTVKPLGSTKVATATTANGIWRASLSGLQKIRVYCTAYTSGTAVVTIRTSTGDSLGQTEVSATTISTANAAAAGIFAGVSSYGYLRTTTEPSALFNDGFEGSTPDTTNRWNTPTQTGSGSVSVFSGMLSLSISSANSSAAITSKPQFGSNTGLGFLAWGCLVSVPASGLFGTNGHQFWGLGYEGLGWSFSNPLQDGVGFEVTSAGVLRACVYSASTLVFSQNLTSPAAGGLQRFVIAWRNDTIFWYIDTTDYPVASLSLGWPGFPGFSFLGDRSIFPVRYHCISGASAPAGNSTAFSVAALGVGDTSHSNQMISDGNFPWRKAKVSTQGELYVKESPLTGYVINISSVATANNKSMASVVNASSAYNVRVQQIWLVNTQTTAVTGVNCLFGLRRCTGHSAGSDFSTQYVKLDSTNVDAQTIATIRTNGTIAGEVALDMVRMVWTTEELTAGLTYPLHEKLAQYTEPFWGKKGQEIILRNGEGITLKCLTSTTTGSFDVRIVYILEPTA
jgi:hypothetical protein